ncbi:efflux RND transporter periplasmic adaptor subunit [Hyphobacterium sp.]|uniref:efflux RND transporter periplasmic adaptor subunit n=1 Tax=Hyphobacterium sp. TaxID=2004662 RepID=UPI003BAB1E2E
MSAVIIIALVFAAIGAGGGWYVSGMGDETAPPQQAASATTSTPADSTESAADPSSSPAVAPRPSGLVASGYVVARRQATVSAEITGRIREILFEEGTQVEAGQVLARLDDTRARLTLEELRARLSSSRSRIGSLSAQLDEARIVLERAQRLAENNIGSEAAVTSAQAQVDSLEAQIRTARADVSAAEVQVRSQEDLVDRHVVRAPFAGVVIAKNAQIGEILSPASAGGGFTRTGVATLVDMASLEIEVDVNEGQIQRVSPGQRVEAVLDAYPDWDIPSHVEAIIPTADRSRATIQVRVAFDERDNRILPDMAARVTFLERE